jgi:hypothetical protein
VARQAFIISKPLQLMVALVVADQIAAEDVHLLLVNSFAGADAVTNRLNLTARWGRATLLGDHAAAYRLARDAGYEHLFIDSDVGLRKFFTLRHVSKYSANTKVHVYEEGIGTYRRDLYVGWKKRLLDAMGAGATFGGSKYTSDIYVFDPDQYRGQTKAVPIRKRLADFISEHFVTLSTIFDAPHYSIPASYSIGLYLSGWSLDYDVVVELIDRHDTFIVKPHPHIQEQVMVPGAIVAPAACPAEILIAHLVQGKRELTVYHHGSSTAHYLTTTGAKFSRLP